LTNAKIGDNNQDIIKLSNVLFFSSPNQFLLFAREFNHLKIAEEWHITARHVWLVAVSVAVAWFLQSPDRWTRHKSKIRDKQLTFIVLVMGCLTINYINRVWDY
jgi:hypothetical protein